MNNLILNQWFDSSLAGGYLKKKELDFYRLSLQELQGETIVQVSMLTWPLLPLCNGKMLILQDSNDKAAHVRMLPECSAWGRETIDVLIFPHILSCSETPDKVLAEAYYALKPQGKLVLTEFNPHSLWGLAKAFDGERLTEKQYCLALPDLKKKAMALGFSVERGRFMGYAPFIKQGQSNIEKWAFMEAAGNRWWPHAAAAYGLVLVKQVVRMMPLLKAEQVEEPNGMVLGIARANTAKTQEL